MVEKRVICDKCNKLIEGNYYSEIQCISKYKTANTKSEDFFSDLLFGAAQSFGNDMKIEVCPECAAKIKEDILGPKQ